jgi:hypothetical protein
MRSLSTQASIFLAAAFIGVSIGGAKVADYFLLRYELESVGQGAFVRLDRHTGRMITCRLDTDLADAGGFSLRCFDHIGKELFWAAAGRE